MTITLDLLRKLCPKTPVATLSKYVEPLNETAIHYEINSDRRVAAFLAQIAHESGGFKFTTENLSYSATGLRKTFGKYFQTMALANEYARKPERIANRVYSNRMGNGNEASGDGWKFRGRGLIQLTGRHNYARFADDVEMGLDECVDHLSTPDGAVASAAWFFDQNNLWRLADAGDMRTLTRRINGGLNGLDDRIHHYELALMILSKP